MLRVSLLEDTAEYIMYIFIVDPPKEILFATPKEKQHTNRLPVGLKSYNCTEAGTKRVANNEKKVCTSIYKNCRHFETY